MQFVIKRLPRDRSSIFEHYIELSKSPRNEICGYFSKNLPELDYNDKLFVQIFVTIL